MRTWDHACIHVLMFMCAVWKVLWVLVVTLSLVSCSVSPRKRKTKCRVLSFWILLSTFALVVRLYSVIVNFICSQIIAHFSIAKTGHLRCCLYMINVGQIEIGVRGWNLFFACLVETTRRCTSAGNVSGTNPSFAFDSARAAA